VYSRARARALPWGWGCAGALPWGWGIEMTEKRLWKRVRERMARVRGWHGTRIEASSGEAMVGTPDAVITAGGRTRWVELKCWPEPLNPHQRVWCLERDATGADGVLVLAVLYYNQIGLMPWEDYDRGHFVRGWHGTMADVPEAFLSKTWRGIR